MGRRQEPAHIAALLAFVCATGALGAGRLAGAAAAENFGGNRPAMRNARYCEIFVIRRHFGPPDAEVYQKRRKASAFRPGI